MEPFETFAVGSLPRPRRAQEVVAERREGLRDEAAAEALLDAAVPLAVRLQGRAGLDVVSDGEWRRESEAYEKLRALARGGELLRERYA